MNVELKPAKSVAPHISRAAHRAYENGGSPRAQIDAAREAAGRPIVYMPHQGAREIARNLRRLEKAASR